MSIQTEIDRIITAVGAAYDAVEQKGGTVPQSETVAGLAEAIESIPEGGTTAAESNINFYDYDGMRLYAWTFEELTQKTELPPLPVRDGLVCQGWNWTLSEIKAAGHEVDIGANYITDDGKTRIYIHLNEGRTSPMLGICPNGTITVDWGDGTTPDTLTGTSTTTVKWTPTHAYTAPGDYVIKLTADGTFGFYGVETTNQQSALLRHASGADGRNQVYQNSVLRIEIGSGMATFGDNGISSLRNLRSITIPTGVTAVTYRNFANCNSLLFIAVPRTVTKIDSFSFNDVSSARTISFPHGIVGNNAAYAFFGARTLDHIVLPDGISALPSAPFQNCFCLRRVVLPFMLTTISAYMFASCYSLSTMSIPGGVESIGDSAFASCFGVRYYDFTRHASVPTLANANAFTGIPDDCEIRVPSSLADDWKAATNWATYADHIVGVET
mgnify:CR=1 FL=1